MKTFTIACMLLGVFLANSASAHAAPRSEHLNAAKYFEDMSSRNSQRLLR